ncbi:MAG: hypothetical protein NZ851_01435 [Aquificaceae bacterium]|nr:hypothetical protein [Aquificaceae bacterium]
MEIRRVEGALLQHAMEQSQSLVAQKTGEELRVRILSTVTGVLLELSSGGEGAIRARVAYSEGRMLTLVLPNGLEVMGENRSSLNLTTGDMVELKLESVSPLTFKIVGLYRKNQFEELLKMVFEETQEPLLYISPERLREDLENSGIFYEKKLFNLYLDKLKPEELLKDAKAQILQYLLKDIETLSNLLGVENKKTPEEAKNLLGLLKERVHAYQQLKEAIKNLFLENLNHEEYANVIKNLESSGEIKLIAAIERGDLLNLLREILKKQKMNTLERHQTIEKAFRELQSLEESALKELLSTLEKGSERAIKEAYEALKEYMDRGEKLLDFYRTRGQALEQLINRLDLIVRLQWQSLIQGNAFYMPIHYEDAKGSLLFRGGKDYTVIFKLDYGEDFMAGILNMPKAGKLLDIKFFTNKLLWADKLKESRDTLNAVLEEGGIKLRNLSVELLEKEKLMESVRTGLVQEGFLLIA